MQSFRRVLAAEVVSNFGSMLTRLVIPWIATLMLGATPLDIGLLAVADLVAAAAGALLLGALVDRLPARRVMVLADCVRALLSAGLALAVWRGAASIGLLMAIAAAGGLATMAFELARSAWMARNLGPDSLVRRNAELSAAGNVTEAASFGVGGWLYQALGGALSLAIDAASYAVSALCLAGVAEPRRPAAHAARGPTWRNLMLDARTGLGALASAPTLRALAIVHVAVVAAMSLAGTSYMIYVARDLAIETGVLGLVFAVGGVGSALGAWLAPALGTRVGGGAAIAAGLGLAASAAFLVPLAAPPAALAILLLVLHQLVGDAGYVVHEIHARSLRQSVAAEDQVARIDAGIRMLGQCAALIGAVAGGSFATAIGARSALFVSAALLAVAAWLAWVLLVRAGASTACAGAPSRAGSSRAGG
jgi:Na+/melibiose symporter-like transporter